VQLTEKAHPKSRVKRRKNFRETKFSAEKIRRGRLFSIFLNFRDTLVFRFWRLLSFTTPVLQEEAKESKGSGRKKVEGNPLFSARQND